MSAEAGVFEEESARIEASASWRERLLATLAADVGTRDPVGAGSHTSSQRLDVLSFHVGTETYGVKISDVAEILLPRTVTPLPRAPEFVIGVVSLRGTVLPVVSLARRLGLVPRDRARSSRIVVLRDGEENMGFWVDQVSGVVRFPREGLETTDFSAAVDSRFLQGIGYDRKGSLVAVLRCEALCDFSLEVS